MWLRLAFSLFFLILGAMSAQAQEVTATVARLFRIHSFY